MQRKNCEVCKKNFILKVHNQKVCSSECRRTHLNQVAREKRILNRKWDEYILCPICKKIVKRNHGSHRQKYCNKCRIKVTRQRAFKRYNELHKRTVGKKIICLCCGKEFVKMNSTGKYCSNKCGNIIRNNKNKEKLKVYKRRWGREKYNNDIDHKIKSNLRNRIFYAIRNKAKKLKRTEKLLGCTIDFLKKYLQLQFIDGMTFENYGKWEIDHIKPCAAFDLTKPEEQTQCFNYSNLQPLWKKDNLTKNSKYQGKLYRKKAKNQLNLKTFLNL